MYKSMNNIGKRLTCTLMGELWNVNYISIKLLTLIS